MNRTPSASLLPKKLVPVSQILGVDLPPRHTCDALIDAYFQTVHWFSLVVYEPKFRVRYHHIMENREADITDQPFLMLLLMVLAMGCWYGPGVLDAGTVSAADLGSMRVAYIKIIRSSFIDLIDEECLEFVQLCALLGSYWLYWGKPRSSFSILGAATKTSQALGLHRNPSRRLAFEDAEERKRVWWTIYTWDRSVILEGLVVIPTYDVLDSPQPYMDDLLESTIRTATYQCLFHLEKMSISCHMEK